MANIALLGPPGSGKGTQAEILSKEYGWPQISPGNILRHAREEGLPIGEEVNGYLARGELVPDRIIDEIIRDRLGREDCKAGFILDGFPRDLEQANALESIARIDAVFYIAVPDETLIRRLTGRLVCDCGETYHLENRPPKKAGICDACGKALHKRKDDEEETVRHRLSVYHRETEPLIGYYRREGLLVEIDGKMGIDRICDLMRDRISKIWTT